MGQAFGGVIDTAARLWSRGIVGVIAAGLAVVACYGLLALTALLPLVGLRLVVDGTVWTAAIVVLTLVTVIAVIPGGRCHRSVLPGGAAIVGGGLILYALLVAHGALLELGGFVLLITAVAADASLRQRALAAAASGTAARGRGRNSSSRDAAQRCDGRQIS